jgi:hypothetical protein
MVSQQNNKFDFFLSFYIFLLVFGGIGGALQPIRIFIIICTPLMLIYNKENLLSFCRNETIIFVIWFIYAVASLPFVVDITESIQEPLYLLLYFLGFYVFVFFAINAGNPKKSIVRGWIAFFVVTLPIAFVELFFDKHLAISAQDEGNVMNYGDGVIIDRFFASVTFGNLNGYNTVLVYILPFVFGFLLYVSNSKQKKLILFSIFLILSLVYIIIINSSRAATGALIITTIIFMFNFAKNVKSLLWFLALLGVAIYVFLSFFPEIFIVIISRAQLQGFGDASRSEIILKGLDALVNSRFFGVGTGNFQSVMSNVYGLRLTAAHNLFLEILVQYGIIIFSLFIFELCHFLRKQRRIVGVHYKFIVVTSIILLPLSSIINSGYLLNASFWLLFYSLYVLSDKRFEV